MFILKKKLDESQSFNSKKNIKTIDKRYPVWYIYFIEIRNGELYMDNINILESTEKDLLKAIYSKLESLEAKVAKTELMLKESNGIIGMSVDTIDSFVKEPDNSEKVAKLELILKRLSSNESIDSLLFLVEKLEKLSPLIKEPKFIDFTLNTVVDTIDGIASDMKSSGVEFSSLLQEVTTLIPKLANDKTIKLLNTLLDRAETFANYIAKVDQVPGAITTVVDTFDEYAKRVNTSSTIIDLKNDLVEQVSLERTEKVLASVHSSLFSTHNHKDVSILELVKMMNDKNVKKQIYLVLSLIKNLGEAVSK